MKTALSMLRTCSFANCHTVTLSTYCFEHEQRIRAAEAEQAASISDAPLTRDSVSWRPAALMEPPELPAA
jgi:hypothetical protein